MKKLILILLALIVGCKNQQVVKIIGTKCNVCRTVFSAETTLIERGEIKKDTLFQYNWILCDECEKKLKKEAERLFNTGLKSYRRGDYELAQKQFMAAARSWNEHKKAREWLAKTNKRLAAIKKKQEAQAKIMARKIYAKLAREAFLDQGMDVKVKVHGPKYTYITLTWSLIGDVFVHKFRKSEMCNEIHNLGFTRIYLRDGYRYSTYVYWEK